MSPERRRLSQLPALVVADSRGDVRGWPVIAHDGRTLGTVADLLVDVDRLTADFLLVSMAGASAVHSGDALVPVTALACDDAGRRLVAGSGMAPIQLRYRSTVPLAAWTAVAAAVLLILAWALGLFDA